MADFDDWGFGEDDEDQDGNDSEFRTLQIQRDGLILLIDTSKSMFEKNDTYSAFEQAIKCAIGAARNKIMSNDKDLVAVVFYGTRETKNPNDFNNVYIFKELDQPGADTILDLETFLEDGFNKFEKEYGHSTKYQLSDALWACSNMFSKCPTKLGNKRILLITNNDNPSNGNAHFKKLASSKINDLEENNIIVELIPILNKNKIFDDKLFWKDVVHLDENNDFIENAASTIQEFENIMKAKVHKARPQTKISLKIGQDVEISVGVYNLIRPSTKPAAVKLYKKTNEELKSVRQTFVEETGEVLLPQDMKKSQKYSDKQICFEVEEINEMKKFVDVGLNLIGFKPISYLKKDFHVRPAQFLYPDNMTVSGSTTLFTALLTKCLERDVFALCTFVPRKNAFPRFVALLPQAEERDEHSVQQIPPGFHIIYLPFADDFRKVKQADDIKSANREQVDAAKKLIEKLSIPYKLDMIENPSLQTHFANVEAMALDRNMPDEVTDLTEPDVEGMKKKAGNAINQFKNLVFPEGYVAGAKRKALSSNAGNKKSKIDIAEVNVEDLAKNGTLATLTVPLLKEACAKINAKPKGSKKADLIDAINAVFGK